jgi:hypothetical protein
VIGSTSVAVASTSKYWSARGKTYACNGETNYGRCVGTKWRTDYRVAIDAQSVTLFFGGVPIFLCDRNARPANNCFRAR